ncbi:MAG: glycosyltransferase family 2 protein [Firmicutes bacterium]|nr:glycosyltransferase family 2 protein [Bacillota bacterium]MCL1953371.1 glycosyltransferase family 2 protein [Bacillota bacterium]
MTNQIRVSIIIPFYNVEKYIAECLDSILACERKDIEIILIDDCGQDNSRQIVEQYSQRDSRVVLLSHEYNKKQGGARNTGIAYASGEYIWFVDSDDTIAFGAMDKLCTYAKISDADALIFDIKCIYQKSKKIKYCNYLQNQHSLSCENYSNNLDIFHTKEQKEQLVLQLMTSNPIVTTVFFKRTFLATNNLYFRENVFFEDSITLLWLSKATKIAYCKNSYFYNYRVRANSTITSTNNLYQKFDSCVQMMQEIIEFLDNKSIVLNYIVTYKLFSLLCWHSYLAKDKILEAINFLLDNRLSMDRNIMKQSLVLNGVSNKKATKFVHTFFDDSIDKNYLYKCIESQIGLNIFKNRIKSVLPIFLVDFVIKIKKKKQSSYNIFQFS